MIRKAPLRIPLGDLFILTVEDQPIELKISACLSRAHYFDYGLRNADENYRFLIFKVRGHNLGRRLVTVELMDRAEVLVDKGYVYEREAHPFFALRPEEFAVDYAVFQILSTVKPVEVSWRDLAREFLIDLRGADLEEFYDNGLTRARMVDTDH